MNRLTELQHIVYLIVKERLGIITSHEIEQLTTWRKKDSINQQRYDYLSNKTDIDTEIGKYSRIDVGIGWNRYKERYVDKKKIRLYRWSSIAAAVVILFLAGFWLSDSQRPSTLNMAEIHPGSSKAVLCLSDGSIRELTEVHDQEIPVSGVRIINTGKEINYTNIDTAIKFVNNDLSEYNILKIPQGGEYVLVLADGSRVWLNAQTTLRYPVRFQGNERRVFLEGEAYFEVARNTASPFIVETIDGVEVEVLGTAFNMRTYQDEGFVETVLEKGSVKMLRGEKSVFLVPGTKAVYQKAQEMITMEKVDTELYTAWRKGRYIFLNEPIENILQRLSRWYGMNVFFADERAKEVLFSGDVRKYDTILNLLEAMELSGGVHFIVKGNTITVSSGK